VTSVTSFYFDWYMYLGCWGADQWSCFGDGVWCILWGYCQGLPCTSSKYEQL